MRILIAEDEIITRKLMARFLGRIGECDQAKDGNEAICLFEKAVSDSNPYRLICMDILMPNINGLEALMQIRQVDQDQGLIDTDRVKVIMVTETDHPADVQAAIYRGDASAYLVKPITREDLIQELRNLSLIDHDLSSSAEYVYYEL